MSKRTGIVYLDDDDIMLCIFETILRDHYDVHITKDPDESLELLGREDVNIIISDQWMPQIDGVELLEKALKLYPHKGRILVTGNNSIEVIKKAINIAEINLFISKPWVDGNLKFAIDKVNETYVLRQDNLYLQEQLKSTIEQQRGTLKNQKRILNLSNSVIKKLNSSKVIQVGEWQVGVEELTETLSNEMDVSRVAVWIYNNQNNNGNCIDLYSLEENSHRSGYPLDEANYEGITDVMKNECIIQVKNVKENIDTKLPATEYLERHDIYSVLYIPFYIGRDIYGILACEQQHEEIQWSNDEVQFIMSVADIVRLTYRTYERRAAEDELKEAYEELQATHSQLALSEKMASLGQLTAGIAHEINNPINFVYAGINALDRNIKHSLKLTDLYAKLNGGDNKQLRDEISLMNKRIDYQELIDDIRLLVVNIREGATRTAEIVKGLRNFSRLDEAERKMADLHDGINSTLVLLRSQMGSRIELNANFDENIKLIYCYPGQLNQVFMNLLSNSIQAIEGKGTIEITTSLKGDHVKIEMSDSGVGMAKEVVEKIFDPFFTTKDVGVGTGLGLSISYGIIEKHGGTIKVESKMGAGTKFIICIPKQF